MNLLKTVYTMERCRGIISGKTKQEIDLIADSSLHPILYEIKSGMTMQENYFSNLKYWQKLSGEESHNLNVIYGGANDFRTSKGNYISWKNLSGIFDKN